jgi:DNA mismatch endonuclease (patch repair protein)
LTDVYSPEKRSAVMRRVKSSATKPELAVRRLIWSLGGRYRLNRVDLPGKPDIVLAGRRLAIFVHGCFWHGHDCARGARVPKANRDYWLGKVGRNRERDAAARGALADLGWRVETVWECEIKEHAALKRRFGRLLSNSTPKGTSSPGASPGDPFGASGAMAAAAAATPRSAPNG